MILNSLIGKFTGPPSTGYDFPDLQLKKWVEEATVGNSGQKPGGHGTFTLSVNAQNQQVITIVPGVGPDKVGYDNYFFGCHGLFIPKLGQIARVVDTIKFKVDNIASVQAVEWESQRSYPGRTVNMAFCVDPHPGRWAIFDYDGVTKNGDWVPVPSIPYAAALFADWVTVVTEYLVDEDAQTKTHVSATINGKVYPIGITYPFSTKDSAARFDVNFQLGSTGIPKGHTTPPPFTCTVADRHVRADFPLWGQV